MNIGKRRTNYKFILVGYFITLVLLGVLVAAERGYRDRASLFGILSFYLVSLVFLLIECTSKKLQNKAAGLALTGSTTMVFSLLMVKLISRRIEEWLKLPSFACIPEAFLTVFLFAEALSESVHLKPDLSLGNSHQTIKLSDLTRLGLCLGSGYWLVQALICIHLKLVPQTDSLYEIRTLDLLDLLSFLPIETAGSIALKLGRSMLEFPTEPRAKRAFRISVLFRPFCVNLCHSISLQLASSDIADVRRFGININLANTGLASCAFFYEIYSLQVSRSFRRIKLRYAHSPVTSVHQ